jgi:hypothetical protein
MDEAYEHYEGQMSGLGSDFLNEVLTTFKRIKLNPESWSPFSKRTRRCLMKRFPYGIIYQIRENDDELLIVAIAHLHRRPGYWKDRIE